MDNGGDLMVSVGCRLDDNSASKSGGDIDQIGGEVTSAESSLTNNKSCNGGADHLTTGPLTIEGGSLSGNGALNRGGGIDDASATVRIKGGCTVSDNVDGSESNSSSGSGGCAYERGGSVVISGCAHDSAVDGGAVYVAVSSLSIATSALQSNMADKGEAISQFGGRVKLSAGCTLSSDSAQHGGAIVGSCGSVNISCSKLANNTARSFGGGNYVSFGTLTINCGTLLRNTARAGGGLFDHHGDVDILLIGPGGSGGLLGGEHGKIVLRVAS